MPLMPLTSCRRTEKHEQQLASMMTVLHGRGTAIPKTDRLHDDMAALRCYRVTPERGPIHGHAQGRIGDDEGFRHPLAPPASAAAI